MKISLLRYIILVVSVAVASQVLGQDMLASQAPMDKQMARIDSVVLNRLIQAEAYLS